MKAYNERNGRELSDNVIEAERIFDRMVGLIGKESFDKGEALWIRPCKGIHTFGVRFPIDALFLDADNTVAASRHYIHPNRISAIIKRAKTVLELPAGTLADTETREGDTILFR